MIRSWALAPMLLVLAAGCDGETFFLGEKRHDADAGDDDFEPAADTGRSLEVDAAHGQGQADAGWPDARSDARPPFEAGAGDAADRDAELDDNAWASCDWTNFGSDCPPTRPYCTPVAATLDPSTTLWVCLECGLYTNDGCNSDQLCISRWNLVRPEAACVLIDAGRPPPRGGTGT